MKGDRRFFLPRVKETLNGTPTPARSPFPFEYRPLTVRLRAARYGNRNQQDKIIAEAVGEIPRRLKAEPQALATLMGERRRNGKDEPVSHLEHHLRQYTRRNDSDFFIHKDLRGFLSRELDFYLKNEVLNLDNLEAAGEQAADGWFQQMRLLKSVGVEIIDFLAQIEGFQKMLWEKRKFVIDTQYCVTLENVAPRVLPGDCLQRGPVGGVERAAGHRRGRPLRLVPRIPAHAAAGYAPLRRRFHRPPVGVLRRPGGHDRRPAGPQRELAGAPAYTGRVLGPE